METLAVPAIKSIIDWHTRRGIRQGCLCNFCLEKQAATRDIGYTRFPFVRYQEVISGFTYSGVPIHNFDTDEIARDLIKEARERKRNYWRIRMQRAKEEII